MAQLKREEDMTEAELDAELRSYGIDPENLFQNAFSKLCEVVRAKSARIAELETKLAAAESKHVRFMVEGGPVVMASEYGSLERKLASLEWTLISKENLPKEEHEIFRDLGPDGISVEAVDAQMAATWTIEDYMLEYWTHFRPISAPPEHPAPETEEDGK